MSPAVPLTKSKQQTPKLVLDPLSRKIGPEGIDGFYWPYTRVEIMKFDDLLCERYSKLVGKEPVDTQHGMVGRVLLKYFVSEAICLFQGLLLKQRCEQDGVTVEFEAIEEREWRLWPAILNDRHPERPGYFNKLQSGPQKNSSAKRLFSFSFIKKAARLLKLKKGAMRVDGLALKPMTPSVYTLDIVASQRLSGISQHASEVKDEVVFSRSERYFRSIDNKEIEAFDFSDAEEFIAFILKLFEETAHECGASCDDNVRDYLRVFTHEMYVMLSIHLERLLSEDAPLPQRLWIGTTGHLWDALLACAVKLKGGYICGHDHGSGLGHVYMGFAGFIDLWVCDEFRTFSEGQAEGLKEGVPDWAYLGFEKANIGYPADQKATLPTDTLNQKTEALNIVLFSTIYDRDRGRMGPLMPDIIQVDWQVRLIAHLTSWGHNVIVKAHPESPFQLYDAFESMGAKIYTARYENIDVQADIFMFDHIYTSVFCMALNSNVPMIVFDFDKLPWTENAERMIKDRAQIVHGRYDEQNRLQLDWDGFKSDVENAVSSPITHDFLSYYYSSD